MGLQTPAYWKELSDSMSPQPQLGLGWPSTTWPSMHCSLFRMPNVTRKREGELEKCKWPVLHHQSISRSLETAVAFFHEDTASHSVPQATGSTFQLPYKISSPFTLSERSDTTKLTQGRERQTIHSSWDSLKLQIAVSLERNGGENGVMEGQLTHLLAVERKPGAQCQQQEEKQNESLKNRMRHACA